MADGLTHERVAQATLVVGGMAALFVAQRRPDLSDAAILFFGGLANGLLITPDIDMPTITREEQRWYEVPLVGWLIGSLIYVYWFLYAKMFSHRGISHIPVIGTLTRILYQFSMFVALWMIWAFVLGIPQEEVYLPLIQLIFSAKWLWIAFVSGWIIQDNLHILFDVKGIVSLVLVWMLTMAHIFMLGRWYGL